MLVVFAVPTVDTECTKDIDYFVTDNCLTSIAKKTIRSTSLNNVIFKSAR
jgi:hypothetical protein